MKRSVLSILVQTAYRTSLTLLDNFTARADYLKCLVWLQASSALVEEGKFSYYRPDERRMESFESIFGMEWRIPGKEELDKVSPFQYPFNSERLSFGKRTTGKTLYIESLDFKEPLGGFVDRCVILDHASLASQHFPQAIGRGLRRDVPLVIYDEDVHPSDAAFQRAIERMRSMRVLKSEPLTANELDQMFHGSVAVTTDIGDTGVKWEDYDPAQTLAAIQELRELDPQTDLERRRQAFLDGLWEPGFKDAYEQEMVKKGGH